MTYWEKLLKYNLKIFSGILLTCNSYMKYLTSLMTKFKSFSKQAYNSFVDRTLIIMLPDAMRADLLYFLEC